MARKSSADKIVQCATKMFAQEGFAGTIMDALALKAEVNKATIYYHFKDKEHLYEEVLVQHLQILSAVISETTSTELSAVERLENYIRTFATHSYKHKDLISILMREIAGGGDKMPNRAKAEMHKILMTVKSILTQGVKEDSFIQTDVLTMHFMIIGGISFYISSEPMRKMMVSSDKAVQKSFVNSTIDETADNIIQMIKRALLKTRN